MAVNDARSQVVANVEANLVDEHIHNVEAKVKFHPVISTAHDEFLTSTPRMAGDVPLPNVLPHMHQNVMRPAGGLNYVNPTAN